MRRHCKTSGLIACTLPFLVSIGGCSGRRHEPEYRAMDGRMSAIDVQSRMVTFRFLNEQSGKPREQRGLVPDETEILIDGRLSELSDIVVGERVSVVWRIEKVGARRLNTALKIHVERADEEPSP